MAVIDAQRGYNTAFAAAPSVPAAIAGLALLAAVFHVVTPFNHDEAYFMVAGGWLLDGGRFGKDILDFNPPHVYWISVIPVWLAREIGARVDIVATFFTAALAAISLIVSDRLIATGKPAAMAPRALLPIAAIIVLFAPGYDFGQREHWMVLLTLPYVIARCRRADGATLSPAVAVMIGVAACLGFCIKPYYLLVPVALELWLLMRTRRSLIWIAPETMAMGIAGLAYLVAVIVYVPTYFSEALPNALLGYWSFKGALSTVLWVAVILTVPAVVLGLLGYITRRRVEGIPTLAQAFAMTGVAFLVAAVWQMKPWSYHFLPSAVFLDLAVAVLLVGPAARAGASTIRFGALFALIVCGCLPSITEVDLRFNDNATAARVEKLAAVFRAHPGPNAEVAGFLTSPRDVFPAVVASRMNWAVPFCCDYLIAAAVRADEAPAAERQAIRTAGVNQAERAIAAMRAKKPGVIVIDAGKRMLGFRNLDFDYLRWLGARTDVADLLRHYREIGPVGSFRLFVRK